MSSYLLDTHVLLWAASGSARLSGETRELIENPRNDVLFSVVSLWEVAIKAARGRKDFSVDVVAFRTAALSAGWRELPLRGHHVLAVPGLPALHADPFDRMLLAQAATEELALLTADQKVLGYGKPAAPA